MKKILIILILCLPYAVVAQNESCDLLPEHGADINARTDRYFGRNMLMEAVRDGDEAKVRCLVECGADIHATDWRRATPVMHAAATGNPGIVEYLLSRGADLNGVDALGYTLLHYAAEGGLYKVVPLLLDKGLAVDARDKYLRTPLMISVMYVFSEMYDEGPSKNAAPTARVLIERGADVNASDFEGMTPLMFAVRGYYVDAVELMVKSGADIDAENKYGDTAGMFYSPSDYYYYYRDYGPLVQGSTRVEELLGLDVSRPDENEEPLWLSPSAKAPGQWAKDQKLMEAVQNDDVPAIETALAEGADIFYFDDADSPMKLALEVGCAVGTLRFLVGNGAWVDTVNWSGTTALMRAVMGGDLGAAEYFIGQGADVNRKNDYGNAAMIFAAKTGDVRMLELLISHGADIDTQGNGYTPLSLAREQGNLQAVELLESLGAKDEKMY